MKSIRQRTRDWAKARDKALEEATELLEVIQPHVAKAIDTKNPRILEELYLHMTGHDDVPKTTSYHIPDPVSYVAAIHTSLVAYLWEPEPEPGYEFVGFVKARLLSVHDELVQLPPAFSAHVTSSIKGVAINGNLSHIEACKDDNDYYVKVDMVDVWPFKNLRIGEPTPRAKIMKANYVRLYRKIK